MKIALVHATLPNPARRKDGGVTYWVHRLGNHLAAAGHEVTFFSADPRPADAAYGVRPLPAPTWATSSTIGRTFFLPWFMNRIPRHEFDIVHTHGDDTFFFSRRRVRSFYGSALGEFKSATRWRRRFSTGVTYPLELLSALTARAAVAQSETTRRHFPFVRHRVDFGVDRDMYHPGPKSPLPSILFVGTMEGRKRGGFLLDIFQQQVRAALPEAELWMVADRAVSGPGVVDQGKVDTEEHMAELFRSAWIFCLPSTYEGLSLTYLEALASGTVPVLTPNSGAVEAVDGGKAGLLVSDEEMAPALVRVLRDSSERATLETAALSRADFYSWDRTIRDYEAIYREVSPKAR